MPSYDYLAPYVKSIEMSSLTKVTVIGVRPFGLWNLVP